MAGMPGQKVMAVGGDEEVNAATSSGFKCLRAWCAQLVFSFHDVPALTECWPPSDADREPPRLAPPELTTMVSSPSRALTYSAVCWSLTPKKICVVFASNP